MKAYFDQKGNEVKFGELLHYEDHSKKNHYLELSITLSPENLDTLKKIGAVTEKEIAETKVKDLSYYNKNLQELFGKNFDSYLKTLFPQQYLSMIITLIHDDIEGNHNSIPLKAWFFDYVRKRFIIVDLIDGNDYSLMTYFKDKRNADICYNIIKPLMKEIYG